MDAIPREASTQCTLYTPVLSKGDFRHNLGRGSPQWASLISSLEASD